MKQLVFQQTSKKKYEAIFVSGESTALQIQYGASKASVLNIYCRIDSSLDWCCLKLVTLPSKNYFTCLSIPPGINVKIETDAVVENAVVNI